MLKRYSLLLLFPLLVASCSSSSSSKTIFYSLDVPVENSANYGMQVVPFTSYMPFEKNMAYAVTPNGIILDDYNNWIQPPNVLLTQFFNLMLDDPSKPRTELFGSNLKLSGNIFKLECSTITKEVVLSVNILVFDTNSKILLNRNYSQKIKLERLTASAYANAVSDAAGKIVLQLTNDLKSLN